MAIPKGREFVLENVTTDQTAADAETGVDHRVSGVILVANNGSPVVVDLKHGESSFLGSFTVYPGKPFILERKALIHNEDYHFKGGAGEAITVEVAPEGDANLSGRVDYFKHPDP